MSLTLEMYEKSIVSTIGIEIVDYLESIAENLQRGLNSYASLW